MSFDKKMKLVQNNVTRIHESFNRQKTIERIRLWQHIMVNALEVKKNER